jgi:hypothetical protein
MEAELCIVKSSFIVPCGNDSTFSRELRVKIPAPNDKLNTPQR